MDCSMYLHNDMYCILGGIDSKKTINVYVDYHLLFMLLMSYELVIDICCPPLEEST